MAWSGTEAAMADFVDRHRLTFPQANDQQGEVFARYGIPYQPAWAFVDAAGRVEVVQGALGEQELAQRLDALGR